MEIGTLGWSADGETYTLSRRDVVGWKVMPYGPYLADASAAANGDAAANASRDMAVPPTSRIGELWVRSETASRHADSSADWRFAADGFVRTRNIVRVVGAPRHSSGVGGRDDLRVQVVDKTSASFGCCPAESSAEDKARQRRTKAARGSEAACPALAVRSRVDGGNEGGGEAAEEVVTTKEEEVAAVCGWQPGAEQAIEASGVIARGRLRTDRFARRA